MTEPFAIVCRDESTWRARMAEMGSAGWTLVRGDALPAEPFDLRARRLAWCGTVDSDDTQELALTAGLRGAAVLVLLRLADPLAAEAFSRDLIAVAPEGPTGHDRSAAGSPDAVRPIDAGTAALLTRLAAGRTIADAAREGHVSLRTANRMLAAARARYGVHSTTAAVVAHLREANTGTVSRTDGGSAGD
ncbi:helix-turn-helix domain-containing protein [Nakamurella leprariae]|uniref:Uncharacterized protein n=1 Tax=Nakamurella leprariae TaxID=2803911 RepID=A0A939C0E0_9ACTN|nr:hypothetical protein [Nakamurella leprariae]MBM9468656.1 hypothetical protein [Nakamurella leprariae]